MKSTKFWILLLSAVFLLSAAAAFYIWARSPGGTVANIYRDGVCVHSVDLSRVISPYTFAVTGEVENTVAIERGRICVTAATCPDQVCVHQGWITNGAVPVVCLPNRLIIRIEGAPDGGVDAIAR